MGGVASNMKEGMADTMKKNGDTMMSNQKGIAMQQRQAMMASQVAMGRERLRYQCYFYGILFTLLPIGAIKTRNPMMLIPMLPVSFMLAY